MLGMRIAILRASLGLSQAQLARRLGVSSSAVGMYEQGRREPSLDLIVRLAQVFGVTTDYLLTGESAPAAVRGQEPISARAETLLRLLLRP